MSSNLGEQMDAESRDPSSQDSQPPTRPTTQVESSASSINQNDASANTSPSLLSASGISSWAKNLKLPQSLGAPQENLSSNSSMATLSRFTSGLGLRLPTAAPTANEGDQGSSAATQSNVLESITKGLLDSSRNAVKAVQVKARHMVSQNKRRYQEGGFDLDMTYITDNIIAMGFPAGDISSGIFGYIEGLYRNHMEEVIRFFEMHHEGKYKVYNLCSERLYDASLFKGKVATFPFDDHNCPPIQLILAFCQSASSWLEEDKNNVVVVHCKAGMARTGLMICSLLLFLKIFPTAEEAIAYYNQKRCTDGKALVLPSQIRYTTYFDRILTSYNGLIPPGRRCMLRGFRLHKCPYWIRPAVTISGHTGVLFSTKKHPKTKDLLPEDFWIKIPKKGIVVFAIPGEPGLTELAGDFKIHFHERQGDFYCWLNTTMMENRIMLSGDDLDGFEKRKLPSPGLQAEVVMIDYDGTQPAKKDPDGKSSDSTSKGRSGIDAKSTGSKDDDDDVFSDSEGEESGSSNGRQTHTVKQDEIARQDHTSDSSAKDIGSLRHNVDQISIGSEETMQSNVAKEGTRNDGGKTASNPDVSKLDSGVSDFKAIAADASVFTFGDEDDYESD